MSAKHWLAIRTLTILLLCAQVISPAAAQPQEVEVTTFYQYLSTENTNPDFTSWSGGNPTGWTVIYQDPPNYTVTESAPDGNPGTGAALFYRNGPNSLRIEQTIKAGAWYEFDTVRSYTSGGMTTIMDMTSGGTVQWYNDTNSLHLIRISAPPVRYYVSGGPGSVALDRLSYRLINLDRQYSTPADGTYQFFFTLPGSPRQYEAAHLWYRGALGDLNYWDAYIYRNYENTQWSFALSSVSAGVATNYINLGTSGTPNGIRVVTSGDTHTVYTSTDNGANWTSRGSVTNSTHSGNGYIRVLYNSSITPVRLTYPATWAETFPNAFFLPSPTPIPTATPQPTLSSELPQNEVYTYLATAAANVNALPEDASAPGGVAIVPNTDGLQLFGYAKWLWSGTSTRELLGPTLSPLANSAFVWITLIAISASVYLVFTIVTSIVRFVAWLIQQVLKFIPFIG